MGLRVNNVDLNYYYGEALISISRFAELFLACLPYEDGVLDINEFIVKGNLPLDYEDRISNYIDNVASKCDVCELIDLEFYYNNTELWFSELNHAINYYIYTNRDIKVDTITDFNTNTIRMPINKVFETMDKYDKSVISKMLKLTININKEEETELEHLGKLIKQIGVSKYE